MDILLNEVAFRGDIHRKREGQESRSRGTSEQIGGEEGIFKRYELGAQHEVWWDEACVEDN